MKRTWGAIDREGLKMLALSLDPLGLSARSAEEPDLLAAVFALEDRDAVAPFPLRGGRVAAGQSPTWDKIEPATRVAFERGIGLLREAGAEVEPLDLPPAFSSLPEHHATVMAGEAHVTFLSEIRAQPALLNGDIAPFANNNKGGRQSAPLAGPGPA